MPLGEITPINYGQPVNYLQDALLSSQTQNAMQQKYDVNTAKIEGMVEQISSIPIQQQAGKQYLMDKLQSVLNTVSANMKVSGGFGILSNSYTGGITSQIKGAIDDKVKKHIKYSADIINFEKGVVKLKEKDPKAYNQANYEFAQYKAGMQNYLQGDANADLGSLQYVPHKDVLGDLTKKVKDIKDIKGDQVIEVLADDGFTKIKREIKGLTSDEIVKYIPGLLDAQDEQQLMIDGWADMRSLRPEQIAQSFDTFTKTKKDAYTTEINKLTNILTTEKDTLSKEKKAKYEQDLKLYKGELDNVETMSTRIDKTKPEQVGYLFKKEQFSNMAVGMFSAKVNETYELNEIEQAKRKYQLDLEDLAIKKANLSLDEAKAKKELGIDKTKDGSYVDGSGVYKTPVSDQTVDDPEQFVKMYEEEYQSLYNTVYRGVKELYNEVTTPQSTKRDFEASMKKNGFILNKSGDDFVADPNYKGAIPSRAEAMSAALIDSDMSDVAPNEVANIFEAEQTRQQYSDALTQAVSKGKSKEPARYERRLITSPLAVKGGGQRYEDVLVSGTPDDYSAMQKVLESKGLRPNTTNKGQFTFEGKTYKSMLESIPASEIKGGAFDVDKTFTVTQNSAGGFDVTQVLQGTDKNPQKIITATLSGESALAGQLGNIVETKTDVQKETSTKNVPKGYTIKSPLTKSTMLGREEGSRKEIVQDNIDRTIKDASIATTIKQFTAEADAKLILANNLKIRGIDESYADGFVNKLLEKAKNGRLKGEIKAGVNQWGFTATVDGRPLNDYSRVGNSDTLNRDIKKAINVFPTQTVLAQLNVYLQTASKEEIETMNQILSK
jgi:hypothetical protein